MSTIHLITAAALLVNALNTTVSAYQPDSSYQQKLLFTPTQSQLRAESKGSVMIYDKLPNAAVENALDVHFERIESMMFVRTLNDAGERADPDNDRCD